MRKTTSFLLALLALPGTALAQSSNGSAQGPAGGASSQAPRPDPERMEKRMRLARTLGLAEALDLDTAQALRLGDTMAKYDERRKPIRKQMTEANEVLRTAARGGGGQKQSAADVDGAIAKLLEGRSQLQAIDREMLQAVTKDLSPEQKARAALFLGRFRERIERRMWPGPGGAGPGMRPGMMMDNRHPQEGVRGPPNGEGRVTARFAGPYDDSDSEGPPPPFADEEN